MEVKGAHTAEIAAKEDTSDESKDHQASGKPQYTEEGQPPDLEGYPGREGASTGTTNDNPMHRMNFRQARKKRSSHGGNRKQVEGRSNDSRDIVGRVEAQVQNVYGETKGNGGEGVGRR